MAEHTQNGPMVRSQLLITPTLRQRLERIARREGRSLSDVARRALQVGLDAMEGQSDEARQRRLNALHALSELRAEVKARYGVYEGDLIAEIRQEREKDLERIWKGE